MRRSGIQMGLSGAILLGALWCVYPPTFGMARWWAHYAAQITLGYWLLGILLLIVKFPRPMMVAFASCAMLCIYLKTTTNPAMQTPSRSSEPTLRVGHINLSTAESAADSVLATLRKMDADVLSIQEITPNWNPMLDSLQRTYPYKCVYRGVDLYSFGLFSKYPFKNCDTIFCNHVPSLLARIETKAGENKSMRMQVYLLNTYMAPPLFAGAYQQIRQQLDSITQQVRRIEQPLIALGNFNLEAASFEIQQFRRQSNLNDSRRGFRPLRNDGHVSFFEVPVDHIFYSTHLECVDFQTISGRASERLGIMGLYQFVPIKTLRTVPAASLR